MPKKSTAWWAESTCWMPIARPRPAGYCQLCRYRRPLLHQLPGPPAGTMPAKRGNPLCGSGKEDYLTIRLSRHHLFFSGPCLNLPGLDEDTTKLCRKRISPSADYSSLAERFLPRLKRDRPWKLLADWIFMPGAGVRQVHGHLCLHVLFPQNHGGYAEHTGLWTGPRSETKRPGFPPLRCSDAYDLHASKVWNFPWSFSMA